jgi:membrane-associated protease RseP (regulator of RpoE activity)
MIESPQPETSARSAATETVTCPNCGTELARGMRFCRLCGYRLGAGLAEYVETVRLNNIGGLGPMPSAGPLARAADATTQLSATATATAERHGQRHRRRARGLRWLMVPVALFVVTTGGILFVSDITRDGSRISAPAAPRSFFGGDEFERVEGGLMVESVLPGGPAAAAGLRDGDVLVKFDGAEIESEGDLRAVLRETPIGKTVEVEYLRDGEPGRAMLVTINPSAYNARAFVPPNGSGYWGVSNLRRVPVDGTKMHGVKLGDVSANRPADIAGLKEGDIVIEFDGQPVRTRNGLSSYIDHAAPGSVVNVTVIRAGQPVVIPVKMGKD